MGVLQYTTKKFTTFSIYPICTARIAYDFHVVKLSGLISFSISFFFFFVYFVSSLINNIEKIPFFSTKTKTNLNYKYVSSFYRGCSWKQINYYKNRYVMRLLMNAHAFSFSLRFVKFVDFWLKKKKDFLFALLSFR